MFQRPVAGDGIEDDELGESHLSGAENFILAATPQRLGKLDDHGEDFSILRSYALEHDRLLQLMVILLNKP